MPAEHDSHAGHSHATVNPDADKKRLTFALALIVSFMAAEVVVGILARSLALLSGERGDAARPRGADRL